MLDGSYWFECHCYDDEHTVRFTLDKGFYVRDDGKDSEYERPELYMSTFMSTGTFWTRLKMGIKYIFGYKSRYGNFGNWTLCEDDIGKLSYLLADYKEVLDDYNLKTK